MKRAWRKLRCTAPSRGKADVKIWHCVLLPEAGRTEQEDIGPKPVSRPPVKPL